ncbi:hypothetical protein D3C72_1409020 [compost metagenome]
MAAAGSQHAVQRRQIGFAAGLALCDHRAHQFSQATGLGQQSLWRFLPCGGQHADLGEPGQHIGIGLPVIERRTVGLLDGIEHVQHDVIGKQARAAFGGCGLARDGRRHDSLLLA